MLTPAIVILISSIISLVATLTLPNIFFDFIQNLNTRVIVFFLLDLILVLFGFSFVVLYSRKANRVIYGAISLISVVLLSTATRSIFGVPEYLSITRDTFIVRMGQAGTHDVTVFVTSTVALLMFVILYWFAEIANEYGIDLFKVIVRVER